MAYNESEQFTTQLLEVVIQNAIEDTTRFWRWLANSELAPGWFAASFIAIAKVVDAVAYVSDADLQRHVDQYTASIGDGNKVIVVSHSQGNFYANQTYSILFGSQSASSSFSVVGVATPAHYVAGGGSHTTSKEDFIQFVPFVPSPLGWNTSYPDCETWNSLPIADSVLNAFVCHSFDTSYMLGDESREGILDHIVAALPTVAPPSSHPITGVLSFYAQFRTFNSTGEIAPFDFLEATGVDFIFGSVNASGGTFQDNGVYTGSWVDLTDFTFAPFMGPVDPLWSVGPFEFVAHDLTIIYQSTTFLSLTTTGIVRTTVVGLDDTVFNTVCVANNSGGTFHLFLCVGTPET